MSPSKDEPDFLDPKQNPFLPTAGEPEPEPKDEDRSDLDYLVPFKIFDQLTPADLTDRLAAAYPGRQEIEIDGETTLMQMADGSYSVKETATPLADLPLARLLKIRDHLR